MILKKLLASYGTGLSVQFLLWLLGGQPDWTDKESVRQWCLHNHKWLIMIAGKTGNKYDDQFVNVLYAVFNSPELFAKIWEKIQ